MNLCKDCQWWGRCDAGQPWGNCKLAETYQLMPVHSNSLALGRDTGSYRGYLSTAETFGCVQFEAKSNG